jgi:SAM-dependent methyltransferase
MNRSPDPSTPTESGTAPTCRVCGAAMSRAGTVHGRYSARDYSLAQCARCGFACIVDPWTDFAEIYDERYYAGAGADPMVDYHFELDQPDRTIRGYEWDGIAKVVRDLLGQATAPVRWLDYGCGNGGLVRHLRSSAIADAIGFDEGAIADEARSRGIPIIGPDELAAEDGSFDVVTAIEVLEHTLDPLAELRAMRRLLRRGGVLFLTTGNARPYAERISSWRYVIPEIHISFFEPRTLERALTDAGFRPERRALGIGFDEILKFKVLKNLGIRRRSLLTDAIPARLIGPLADRGPRLSEHPIGWAA